MNPNVSDKATLNQIAMLKGSGLQILTSKGSGYCTRNIRAPVWSYKSFPGYFKFVLLNSGSHSDCNVKNSTSYSFFIPTKTDVEWNALISSTPITVGSGTLVAGCCGDGNCQSDLNENCSTCSSDCGACASFCGDGTCDPGETASNCFHDCGKGCCTALTTPPPPGDCSGTNVDSCTLDISCEWVNNSCQKKPAVANCWIYTSLTTCEIKTYGGCSWDPIADACNPVCGDGICTSDVGENYTNCPSDCPYIAQSYCGDGICDANVGEYCTTCPSDCGVCVGCGDGVCSSTETCTSCAIDCNSCNPVGSCCNNVTGICAGSICFGKNEGHCVLYGDCAWFPGQI